MSCYIIVYIYLLRILYNDVSLSQAWSAKSLWRTSSCANKPRPAIRVCLHMFEIAHVTDTLLITFLVVSKEICPLLLNYVACLKHFRTCVRFSKMSEMQGM